MIELSKVTKQFKETTAVQDLSLKVLKGQVYGFIGPNGSGKTTTIKMVVGILRPTVGTIKVDGVNVLNDPVKAKSIIGYIPDDPFVWDNLTGREFLYFVESMFGLTSEEVEVRLKHYLKIFQIEELLDSYFGAYSRGTKQKLTIIAALLHEPKVLVIDEPIVGLDPTSANSALELFKKFAKDGGTVFLTTHTLSAAQKICDRVGFLKDGKLLNDGTLDELYEKAKLPEKSLEKLYLRLVK